MTRKILVTLAIILVISILAVPFWLTENADKAIIGRHNWSNKTYQSEFRNLTDKLKYEWGVELLYSIEYEKHEFGEAIDRKKQIVKDRHLDSSGRYFIFVVSIPDGKIHLFNSNIADFDREELIQKQREMDQIHDHFQRTENLDRFLFSSAQKFAIYYEALNKLEAFDTTLQIISLQPYPADTSGMDSIQALQYDMYGYYDLKDTAKAVTSTLDTIDLHFFYNQPLIKHVPEPEPQLYFPLKLRAFKRAPYVQFLDIDRKVK